MTFATIANTPSEKISAMCGWDRKSLTLSPKFPPSSPASCVALTSWGDVIDDNSSSIAAQNAVTSRWDSAQERRDVTRNCVVFSPYFERLTSTTLVELASVTRGSFGEQSLNESVNEAVLERCLSSRGRRSCEWKKLQILFHLRLLKRAFSLLNLCSKIESLTALWTFLKTVYIKDHFSPKFCKGKRTVHMGRNMCCTWSKMISRIRSRHCGANLSWVTTHVLG